MALHITKKDITTMDVDAIVNAANQELKNYAPRRGGGVCGAIFRAAGNTEMQTACDAIGYCQTGQAVITKGFALRASYVIHAVGPEYRTGDKNQEALLQSCYVHALELAADNNIKTIAFPLISSGIYGYPKEEALKVALEAVRGWLRANDEKITVYLCLLDDELYTMAMNWLNEE